MKILHTEASHGWGGQELRILSEMELLAARGHTVALATPSSAPIFAAARQRGLTVYDLPLARKRLRGVLAMRRFLHTHGFDVVNVHSSTDAWLTALACVRWRDAPALVRTRHISAPVGRDPATRWLYDRACAAVVTTGRALQEELRVRNGFRRVRIESVPTGIALSRFVPRDARQARAHLGLREAPTVGIVATLRSWKGHRVLIDAFSRLPPPSQLLIVGDGPQRDNLRLEVERRDLEARVTFAGHVTDPERWLGAMDVFALPSTANEGVPQALMQAMACGLACVTTPVGAIAEIARHGETALVVPPGQAGPLAEAMTFLLAQPQERARLGAAARAFVSSQCDADRMADRMEEIFAWAAARRG